MHMVFDVKHDGRHKARYVMNGNHTGDLPTDFTYSPVVSLDFIRILFLLAVMNHLDILMIDISCAFLQSKCKEKIYTIAGKEWGETQGQVLLALKSVYGLKSCGSAWFEEFTTALVSLGFVPSHAGPCVFIRRYQDSYEYLVVWVDDCLIFSRRAKEVIASINELYNTKGEGFPTYFLGGDVLKVTLPNDKEKQISYALSAKTYINALIPRVEKIVGSFQHHMFPMDPSYRPESDKSELLTGDDISVYQMMIGSAMWAITLGRYDVQYATISLSRYNQAPRRGHYKAAVRIIGYLKHYSKACILIDPRPFELPPEFEMPDVQSSWFHHYPNSREEIPDNAPEPLMLPIQQTYFVDASHADNKVNRQSTVGILGLIQSTPHYTYCKELKTVESSSYGSEIMAARIATEAIIADRYRLRMLGVPIHTSCVLLGDNKSVQISTSLPSSSLNKKHNAIAYHKVREAAAAGILVFVWICTFFNLADVLTKPLGGKAFVSLTWFLLFGKGTMFTMGSDKNKLKLEKDQASDDKKCERSSVKCLQWYRT